MMATGRSTKLTGAAGEFLVSAELCRRGLISTPFSGNVPYYDIIASDAEAGHIVIQVKAITKRHWQFDAKKFIDITFDGDRQIIGEPKAEPYPDLFCVFVALGEVHSLDRFFVFTWKELRKIIEDHHRAYLKKHGGIRPKAPQSTHISVGIQELEQHEDRWDSILEAVRHKGVT